MGPDDSTSSFHSLFGRPFSAAGGAVSSLNFCGERSCSPIFLRASILYASTPGFPPLLLPATSFLINQSLQKFIVWFSSSVSSFGFFFTVIFLGASSDIVGFALASVSPVALEFGPGYLQVFFLECTRAVIRNKIRRIGREGFSRHSSSSPTRPVSLWQTP